MIGVDCHLPIPGSSIVPFDGRREKKGKTPEKLRKVTMLEKPYSNRE